MKNILIILLTLSFALAFNPPSDTPNNNQDSFQKTSSKKLEEIPVTPKSILETTAQFYNDFKGGEELLKKAEGYLIFPTVYDAGLIVGAKYGYGALVQNNSISHYYKIYSTSVGIKAGIQKFSLIVIFLTKESLNRFLDKEEWKIGLDSRLTFTSWHEGLDINSLDLKKDTLIIPFNQVGIMANLSFEGTVFQQLN